MNEEVPFEVQNGTQESTILEEDLGCREPRQEVGMVNDDFPNDCFEREEETMDDGDISDSSEEGESEDESDEEDVDEQNDANAHAAEALLGLSEVNLDGVQHDDVGGPSVNHTTFEREVHISRPPVTLEMVKVNNTYLGSRTTLEFVRVLNTTPKLSTNLDSLPFAMIET
jgi:hypothetical protein